MFKQLKRGHVHVIPCEDGSREWTCDVSEWRKWQTRATREANKADPEQAKQPKVKDEKKAMWTAVIMKDPVLLDMRSAAGVSPETKRKPNQTEIVALGTRADPIFGLGSSKAKSLEARELPPGFDTTECAKCINGARWALEWEYSSTWVLACGNSDCYKRHQVAGKQRFQDELAKRIEDETSRDKADFRHIKAALESARIVIPKFPRDMAELIIKTQIIHNCRPYKDYESDGEYWPEICKELTVLNKGQLPGKSASYSYSRPEFERDTLLKALKKQNDDQELIIAAALLVWAKHYGQG